MTILDFYADWCSPCKSLAPSLEKVANEKGINLVKINVEEDSDKILEDLGVNWPVNVRNIPTVIAINENGDELARFTGTKSEADINNFFESLN